MWGNSLVELFQKGGACMWPLLLCSIIGLAIILERGAVAFWLRLNFASFVRKFEKLIRAGDIEGAKQQLARYRSPVARIAGVYLNFLHEPIELREDVLGREGSQLVSQLERRLNWLGTIASIATLLGLLGTVTGLVSAFHQIEVNAGQVQPDDLAAGIWEALITTVFGLIIAIPCMAAYQLLDHWAGAVALQMQWIEAYLDEWLHIKPAHHGTGHEDRHSWQKRENVVQMGVRNE